MFSYIESIFFLMQKKKKRRGLAGKRRERLERVIGSGHEKRLLYTCLNRL